MKATLTLQIDSEILEWAEQQASRQGVTLSDTVAEYLRVMAQNGKNSSEGKTPISDSLKGCITLPPDFDFDKVRMEALQEKYG